MLITDFPRIDLYTTPYSLIMTLTLCIQDNNTYEVHTK